MPEPNDFGAAAEGITAVTSGSLIAGILFVATPIILLAIWAMIPTSTRRLKSPLRRKNDDL